MSFLGVNMEEISKIIHGINDLYDLLYKELSQDWKSFTITVDNKVFEINSTTDAVLRSTLIKLLLKDAVSILIEDLHSDEDKPYRSAFSSINRILSGARKEDHQFEIVKEEIVSNLDADGKPITAKPLNVDSMYVQWQDQSKFKFEEE
jgi:hypothetical protein